MKLSDFKEEKGVEVVAKLMIPICKIVANQENAKAKGKTKLEFASAMLQNSPTDVKEILAILADVDPAEYHCNGATVLVDLFEMLADTELMQLFGLQSKTQGPTCSGAQSENTEAPEQ
jgi:hypothetical protein